MIRNTLLSLRGVTKTYIRGVEQVHALRDLSLFVDYGEIISIKAPSGSGKSTLLNIIGALDRPTDGIVEFNGVDISGYSDKEQADFRRRSIGFVFQSFNLLPGLSAWENVAIPRLLDGGGTRRARADAVALLEKVGLSHRAEHRPAELSGGEIQRVAVARALVMNAPLIIADEPTGNLDTKTGSKVVEILRGLVESHEAKHSIIIATHDQDIAQTATRCISLVDGRIIGDR